MGYDEINDRNFDEPVFSKSTIAGMASKNVSANVSSTYSSSTGVCPQSRNVSAILRKLIFPLLGVKCRN